MHSMSQVFSMFSRYFEFPFALCIFIDPMIVVCIFCFAMQLLLHGRLLKKAPLLC
jgi:hypothetical protein